jgi:serine/threonine protein kinase
MNILVEVVDNEPHARIADFGIALVTKNLDSIRPETHHDVHTPRWSAPEVIREQNPSQKSDVYSFAMVMIEVHLECSEIPVVPHNCCLTNTGTHRCGSVQ